MYMLAKFKGRAKGKWSRLVNLPPIDEKWPILCRMRQRRWQYYSESKVILIERFLSTRLLFTERGFTFEAIEMLRCIAGSHFKYFIHIYRPSAKMSTSIFFIWSIQPKTVLHDIAGIITTKTDFFFSRGVGTGSSCCRSKSSIIVWKVYPLLQTIGGWDRECRVTCDLSKFLFYVELIDIIGCNNLTMRSL